MIGNRGYAMYIREWLRTRMTNPYGDAPASYPDGWKLLGSGCYRVAYLSPDGVVYKVQMFPGMDSGQTNIEEYQTWWKLRLRHHEPEGFRWPLMNHFEFDGHDDVNAMDYVGETLSKYSGPDRQRYVNAAKACSWDLGLSDMHHGNIAVDEKRKLIVPIDLGV